MNIILNIALDSRKIIKSRFNHLKRVKDTLDDDKAQINRKYEQVMKQNDTEGCAFLVECTKQNNFPTMSRYEKQL